LKCFHILNIRKSRFHCNCAKCTSQWQIFHHQCQICTFVLTGQIASVYPVTLVPSLCVSSEKITLGYSLSSSSIAWFKISRLKTPAGFLLASPFLSEPKNQLSDRKSTPLNSSHVSIAYAALDLKEK